MTVRIVTDSTSDLTPDICKQLGITMVPLYIHFGNDSYRDGVDITTDQFYQKLSQSKIMPTSGAPSPETFAEVYDRLAEETDEILVIALSSKLSAVHEMETQAIRLMNKKCRIEVIDSLQGAMALGLIVIAAAKRSNQGATYEQVKDLTKKNISRVEIRFAFDTLEYLKRGGRINKAEAFLGSLLKINPILGLNDGQAYPIARKRSRSKAIDYLCNFVTNYSNIEEIAVEDATTPDDAQSIIDCLNDKFPKERIYHTKVSPVVGTHVGPHVLAVSVLGDIN